jgi:ankyrin repeat protein
MCAVLYGDADSVRLLLERGADPNARPGDGSSPLALAAGETGAVAIVKLLLDHGAKAESDALVEAAYSGDGQVFRMVVEHHADLKAAAPNALWAAMRSNCAACFETLVAAAGRDALNIGLVALASFGDTQKLSMLLDWGADVNARLSGVRKDLDGRTPLMLAAFLRTYLASPSPSASAKKSSATGRTECRTGQW